MNTSTIFIKKDSRISWANLFGSSTPNVVDANGEAVDLNEFTFERVPKKKSKILVTCENVSIALNQGLWELAKAGEMIRIDFLGHKKAKRVAPLKGASKRAKK